MQDHRNTKVRNIAERFAPSPSRREMLAGAAVAVIGLGAAAVDTEATAQDETEARRLAHRWAEAIDAQRRACDAEDAAEARAFDGLRELGEMPKEPKPEDFISGKTGDKLKAAEQQLYNDLRRATREISDIWEAKRAAGEASPAYREAMKAHEAALAERQTRWAEMDTARKQHGVDETEEAVSAAFKETDRIGRALIDAPITSQIDALIIAVAALHYAEMNDDDAPLPLALRNRLAPWLPVTPDTWT